MSQISFPLEIWRQIVENLDLDDLLPVLVLCRSIGELGRKRVSDIHHRIYAKLREAEKPYFVWRFLQVDNIQNTQTLLREYRTRKRFNRFYGRG